MRSIKHLYKKDIDLCYELDSRTISLWSRRQWANELKKENIKIFGVFFSNLVIGICAYNVILDEAQINFFAVNKKYREKGYGSYLMRYLINECEKSNINRILLEVSHKNIMAEKFYSRFNFVTVGIRRNYYKDGSDALLKEKKLASK